MFPGYLCMPGALFEKGGWPPFLSPHIFCYYRETQSYSLNSLGKPGTNTRRKYYHSRALGKSWRRVKLNDRWEKRDKKISYAIFICTGPVFWERIEVRDIFHRESFRNIAKKHGSLWKYFRRSAQKYLTRGKRNIFNKRSGQDFFRRKEL